MFRKTLIFKTILFLFLTSAIFSQQINYKGMITRVESAQVVINMGLNWHVVPNTEFYIYRIAQPIGKIKVIQVDEYSSIAAITTIEPGLLLQVGDVVSDTPYVQPPPQTIEKKKPPQKLEDAQKTYDKILKDRTKDSVFKIASTGSIKIPFNEVLNLLSSSGITSYGGNPELNPFYVVNLASQAYNQYSYTKSQSKGNRVVIEVVYWDNELLDAYADYYAYKEAKTSPEEKIQIRNNLIMEKGVDKFIVFHVKIKNEGPGVVQAAPLNWHMYLLNSAGARVKADKYDEVLDKALNPNTETEGYIYFPKTDVQGKSIIEPNQVKVVFEDIIGQSGELNWR